MVISAFISTTAVGYVSNYTTISIAVGYIISNICGPIQALVGNMLAGRDGREMVGFTKRLGYAIYALGAVLILLMALLIDDFVELFYGKEYILDSIILYLLVAELYITQNQSATGLMLDAAGKFHIERQFYIKSAVLTVVLSVLGALAMGVPGVLGGILSGRIYLWWCRGYYCHKYVIKDTGKAFRQFLFYQAEWLLTFLVTWQLLRFAFKMMFLGISLEVMILKAIIILLVAVIMQIVVFGRTAEFSYLKGFFYKPSK